MSTCTVTLIRVDGDVDFRAAQGLAAKIRAAMQNGLLQIELHLAPGAGISSAEFIAFLASTAHYLEERGGALRIRGASGRTRSLFAISRLERLLSGD
jgi:ABC-type transporter Mla MlaB component